MTNYTGNKTNVCEGTDKYLWDSESETRRSQDRGVLGNISTGLALFIRIKRLDLTS